MKIPEEGISIEKVKEMVIKRWIELYHKDIISREEFCIYMLVIGIGKEVANSTLDASLDRMV